MSQVRSSVLDLALIVVSLPLKNLVIHKLYIQHICIFHIVCSADSVISPFRF
jgi:hypothetical protein